MIAYRCTSFSELKLHKKPHQTLQYKPKIGKGLHLHVFHSLSRSNSPAPLIIWFHGGAWQFGNPAQFHPQCEYFVTRGFSCISVEYRIYSIHGTDARAAMVDAGDALSFVIRNAKDLGIDPDRIVVGGGSSGGHLAASLGLRLPLTGSNVRPYAMILFNPMLDLSPGMPDHELVSSFWFDASPMHHASENPPPTLVLLGTNDTEVSVATANTFCAQMRANGGRCDLALYEGAGHGFFNKSVGGGEYFDVTMARAERFLIELGLPSPALDPN